MLLVEKHTIKNKHPFFEDCDNLCFKSKNLYNFGLYQIRQHFFEFKKYLNYNSNYHICKTSDSYNDLPTKVSCQTLKLIDRNFKSFFNHLKSKNKLKKVNIPNYLHKDGRYVTIFPKQSLGLREFKKSGKIKLSKTNILIKTKIKNFHQIKEVRIIPQGNHYIVEVVYEKEVKDLKLNNNRYCSIDLGLNNLATVSSNVINPFIINGKPLKSINQYYNKKKSKIQNELEIKNGKKKSGKLSKLNFKRNNKINDYLHKSSKILVNQLVSNKINTLIIGKNNGWKQDINIGKRNNQNFVQIPFNRFIEMLNYKCKLEGIIVKLQEESYTSKCSFLDNEEIKKHDNYHGKRIKRGLFRSSKNIIINADLNGSYNIMKKAVPNIKIDGIEGLGVNPIKLSIN